MSSVPSSLPIADSRPTASSIAATLERLAPWLAPILVFGLIAWRHWSRFGTYVTGMDAGEWFAIGRGYFGGDGRSTEGAYPPLVPIVYHLANLIGDPIPVAKLLAVLSVVVILTAAYVTSLRGMNVWFALATTATVGLSGVLIESIAFSGAPQNVALTFMMLGALCLSRYVSGGQRRDAILAGVALVGAALSHHTYFPVACVVFAGVWALWLTTTPNRAVLRRRTIVAMLIGAVAIFAFLPVALAFRQAGYDAPVNSNQFDYGAAIRISIREARWLWWPIFIAGTIAYPVLRQRRENPAWQVGASLTAVAIVLFLGTREPRLLPPLMIGTSMGVGLLLQEFWNRTARSSLGAAPLVIAAAMPILLWPFAGLRSTELYNHYRVMDRSLLNTITFVDQSNPDGAVLVRKTAKGWPGGWWFEGLTDETIKVGSDERWLAFPEERANARLAAQVFEQSATAADAIAAARSGEVRYLVFRKGEWTGWQTWLTQPAGLLVAYDDGVTMVLDVGAP